MLLRQVGMCIEYMSCGASGPEMKREDTRQDYSRRWNRRTLDAAPADPVVRADARIDGLIRVGDQFPRLFITTPDGVRKEIRRIEYMDLDQHGNDKYPAWTSSLTKEQSR